MVHQAAERGFVRSVAQDEVAKNGEIVRTGKQFASGWQSVTASAAYFLLIVFEGFRQVEMDHRADVGLVDSHAESDRGDDNVASPLHEIVLRRGANLVRHPRVVGPRGETVRF